MPKHLKINIQNGGNFCYTHDNEVNFPICKEFVKFRSYKLSYGFQVAHGKESACDAGDLGPILGSGRSPGKGDGNPLQYSCLGNSMDRGVWQATVHGVTKSWTQLSDYYFHGRR